MNPKLAIGLRFPHRSGGTGLESETISAAFKQQEALKMLHCFPLHSSH